MKKFRYLFGLVLLAGIHSCECDEKYECPTLSPDGRAAFTFVQQGTIRFINTNGQPLVFVEGPKIFSPAYEAQACKKGPLGCSCDYHCASNGHVTYLTDSSRSNLKYISYSVKEEGVNLNNFTRTSLVLTYDIFDFARKVDMVNATQLFPGDSLMASLVLGNIPYSNVYIQQIDTLLLPNRNKKIWKAYFSKAYGVIGFWDRQTQSLYYRQ